VKKTGYTHHFPLIGFALTMTAFIGVIVVYSVTDYRRMRARVEESLVREGLSIIAAFEASVRTGLSGRSQAARLRALVRDTCNRADLEFFSFVDPSYTVYSVTGARAYSYYNPAASNLYALLERKPYDWGYVRGAQGDAVLAVVKPLLLESSDKIGLKTFRFYQVFLQRSGQRSLVRDIYPQRGEVRAFPLAAVGLPTYDLRALTRQAVMQSLVLGSILLVLSATLVYVTVIVQQHRIVRTTVTELRADNEKLLESLKRTDRLAVLGRMAATMAHELRNPLSSIRGFTQLFRKKAAAAHDTSMCQYADLVISEVDRLNTVITSMLDFSRPVEAQIERCALQPLIENTLRLIKSDAQSRHVTTTAAIAPNLPLLMIDRNLITQALLNLCINALDAMPDGGDLTITAVVERGAWVRISVRDTGKGIPKQLRSQIFEPFFTTKSNGTGLGLASVDNIIAEHGGSIRVDSEMGRGTVFHIELPLTREQP